MADSNCIAEIPHSENSSFELLKTYFLICDQRKNVFELKKSFLIQGHGLMGSKYFSENVKNTTEYNK